MHFDSSLKQDYDNEHSQNVNDGYLAVAESDNSEIQTASTSQPINKNAISPQSTNFSSETDQSSEKAAAPDMQVFYDNAVSKQMTNPTDPDGKQSVIFPESESDPLYSTTDARLIKDIHGYDHTI